MMTGGQPRDDDDTSRDRDRRFIVGEVSKSWINGLPVSDGLLLAELFEDMLEHNRRRGYRLLTFTLDRTAIGINQLNETLIAVFEREDQP